MPGSNVNIPPPNDTPREMPQRRRAKAETLSPAVQIYRDTACLTPTKAQRQLLDGLGDLGLWRETVSYWIGRGWNPRNISGMLERYNAALAEKEKAQRAREAAEREMEERRQQRRPITDEEWEARAAFFEKARREHPWLQQQARA